MGLSPQTVSESIKPSLMTRLGTARHSEKPTATPWQRRETDAHGGRKAYHASSFEDFSRLMSGNLTGPLPGCQAQN